jgi:hypothetical protein
MPTYTPAARRLQDVIDALVEEAVLNEREACAKIIDVYVESYSSGEKRLTLRGENNTVGLAYAEAIRNRT